MKWRAMVLISGALAASSLRCGAEPACPQVVVPASVEAGRGELTLADLMARGSCPQMREAAAQVSLGRRHELEVCAYSTAAKCAGSWKNLRARV